MLGLPGAGLGGWGGGSGEYLPNQICTGPAVSGPEQTPNLYD